MSKLLYKGIINPDVIISGGIMVSPTSYSSLSSAVGSANNQILPSWEALWNLFDEKNNTEAYIDTWLRMMTADSPPTVTNHAWCELWYLVIVNSTSEQLQKVHERIVSSLDTFSKLDLNTIDTLNKFMSVLFFLLLEASTKNRVLAISDIMIEQAIFPIISKMVSKNDLSTYSSIKQDLLLLIDTYGSNLGSLTMIIKNIMQLYEQPSELKQELNELLNACEYHVYEALSSQNEPIQGEWDLQEYLREQQAFLLEKKQKLAKQWQEYLTKIYANTQSDKLWFFKYLPYLVQLITIDPSISSLLSLDSIKGESGIALCKVIATLAHEQDNPNKSIITNAVKILLHKNLAHENNRSDKLYLAHIQALNAIIEHPLQKEETAAQKEKKAALARLLSQYSKHSIPSDCPGLYQNISTTLISIPSSEIPCLKIHNFFSIVERICSSNNKTYIASHIKSALVLQGSEILLAKAGKQHIKSRFRLIMNNASSSQASDIIRNLVRCVIEHQDFDGVSESDQEALFIKIGSNPIYGNLTIRQLLKDHKNPMKLLLNEKNPYQHAPRKRIECTQQLQDIITIYASLSVSPQVYLKDAHEALKWILESTQQTKETIALAQKIYTQLSSLSTSTEIGKSLDDISKLIQECQNRPEDTFPKYTTRSIKTNKQEQASTGKVF